MAGLRSRCKGFTFFATQVHHQSLVVSFAAYSAVYYGASRRSSLEHNMDLIFIVASCGGQKSLSRLIGVDV